MGKSWMIYGGNNNNNNNNNNNKRLYSVMNIHSSHFSNKQTQT